MACERFAGALTAHAAGSELTPDARAHLEHCADCREVLARERHLVAGITRDLETALRVEPSVEFAAGVRERIAARSPAVGWWPGWRWTAAAASLVAAIVVTTIVFRAGSRPTPPAPVTSTQRAERPPSLEPPPAATLPPNATRPARVVAIAHPAPRLRPVKPVEPEVLVPPDQQIAIARLLEMVRSGKLDAKSVLQTPQEVAAPGPLAVAPIVVEQLNVAPIAIAPVNVDKRH